MSTAQKLESAANTVKTMASSTQGSEAREVSEQLDTLRADVSRLMASVAALGKAKSDEVASTVTDAAHDLRRRGETAMDQAAQMTRARPAEALAVAAGLGFLAGLLVRRG